MTKLVGTPPNQITIEERDRRIRELEEKKMAIPRGEENPGWLDEWSVYSAEINQIEKDYPDPPPDQPIVVESITMTCGACPTQWEGHTNDGKSVYVRYRWGYLSVDVNDKTVYGRQIDCGDDKNHTLEKYIEQWGEERGLSMFNSHETTKKFCGGVFSYAGSMTTEELIEHTRGWFVWKGQ